MSADTGGPIVGLRLPAGRDCRLPGGREPALPGGDPRGRRRHRGDLQVVPGGRLGRRGGHRHRRIDRRGQLARSRRQPRLPIGAVGRAQRRHRSCSATKPNQPGAPIRSRDSGRRSVGHAGRDGDARRSERERARCGDGISPGRRRLRRDPAGRGQLDRARERHPGLFTPALQLRATTGRSRRGRRPGRSTGRPAAATATRSSRRHRSRF